MRLWTEGREGEQCQRRCWCAWRKIPEPADAEIVQRADVDSPRGFDTRSVLVVTSPRTPGGPIRGLELAFGGRHHVCFAFVYVTRAQGAGAEQAVGERLAAMQRAPRRRRGRRADPGRRLEPEGLSVMDSARAADVLI